MDKYAIIGNPVDHSLSPIIFKAFGEQTKQTFNYITIKAPCNNFSEVLKEFQKEGGKGANITAPFKGEAYKLSNKQSREAKESRSASALQFLNDSTIYGVNYDGLGLIQDLTRNHNITLTQKSILILGAGGATQGILSPLINTTPIKIVIVNRTVSKAQDLASYFNLRVELQGIGYDDLQPIPYDIIIHATSLGHQGKCPSLPTEIIKPETCCYDLSYGKIALPFLQWAKRQGANKCFDGLGMLVEHNAALFYLWFGIYPNTFPILQRLNRSYTISFNKN
ncbi:shikimate dehydrogenase [Coxiella-like endosymbiont]|uniref:shikimate dehydrogenase n=2 Tax=Coxiellaceae TaxID=118968 RepID=UPI000C809FE4|nr:shikimate dehydrogenase [Coxiella-like endosymbiont]PMB54463.1 Shikimate 5-dehydrogenase I alpha [Coxiella-like endosymbiont]